MNTACALATALLLLLSCHDSTDGGSAGPVVAAAGVGGQNTGGAPTSAGAPAVAGSDASAGNAGATPAGGAAGQPAATPALAVGPFATCATDAEQLVKCVGRCGKAGHGGSREQAPPGVHARALAVGRNFACAVLVVPNASGSVQCWGDGAAAEAPALPDVAELVAGDEHACARSSQGVVTCWGDAAHAVPTGVVAKRLAASGAMTCAIGSDDLLRCWGPHPVTPPPDLKAQKLALSSQLTDPKLGPRFGCAVTLGGDVRCFGDDVGHVLEPPGGLKAKDIAVGRSHACAITLDDSVSCWGTPPGFGVAPPLNLKAALLSLSFRSAGAVTLDGNFTFWGDTSDGRSSL